MQCTENQPLYKDVKKPVWNPFRKKLCFILFFGFLILLFFDSHTPAVFPPSPPLLDWYKRSQSSSITLFQHITRSPLRRNDLPFCAEVCPIAGKTHPRRGRDRNRYVGKYFFVLQKLLPCRGIVFSSPTPTVFLFENPFGGPASLREGSLKKVVQRCSSQEFFKKKQVA